MTETSGYPDYAAPDPNVVVKDLAPGQAEYEAQGGSNFKFWNKVSDTFYSQANVYQYEMLRRQYDNKVRQAEEFEEALKEALSEESIDPDIANEFASIFDINLKREFEYTVTVEFTFTVEIDHDVDPNDVVDSLSYEVTEGWGTDYELDNVDASVSYSNYTEV